MQNVVRGVLALVLTAAATWLADRIVREIFGPDEEPA
jgi:thiol:disulfide interchange protein